VGWEAFVVDYRPMRTWSNNQAGEASYTKEGQMETGMHQARNAVEPHHHHQKDGKTTSIPTP